MLKAILFGVLVASSALTNAQQKRIYIANDDHTDLMWSADAETYKKVFVEMLDWHLKLAETTVGNPAPYRHRFNCDGSYWLWNYEQTKSAEDFATLMERIKEGTISAPLNTVVSCYGGQPLEAVLRGMYYSGQLERRFNLRFPMAVAMENQTLPLGLSSLFAGAGAKYSWRGVCGCATKMRPEPFGNRAKEIYWWTGHDGQRILMKWYSLVSPGNRSMGGYSEAFDPVDAIRFLDTNQDFLERYRSPGMKVPFDVRAAFGFGWDALDRKTGQPYPADPKTYPKVDHFHIIAENASSADRQVIVSNEQDFFEDFESLYGSDLLSESVTYGNEWDLYSASMSETSARVKRAVEKLRSAELISALVSMKAPGFYEKFGFLREKAFIALGLYWEHNWTADGPISRAKRGVWQELVASDVETYADLLHQEAAEELGKLIRSPNNNSRFFVLNPLGWLRTDVADIPYQNLFDGDAEIHVRDLTTNEDVPHQIIKTKAGQFLRVLARDVPSAGYKTYEIQRGATNAVNTSTSNIIEVEGKRHMIVENSNIKITIQRDGAISSFIDKLRGNVELARTVDGLSLNDLAAKIDDGELLSVENVGPVSVTVRARSDAGLSHSTAITMYRDSSRVDIENEIKSNFSDIRYCVFSFAFDDPSVCTEEVGAINLNKLQAAGGDYSETHARYDHITVNHFADITDGSGKTGVTISNADLAFAKMGNSTANLLDTKTPQLHMLAGGQVDGPSLGIPSQSGNSSFKQRFSLLPHGEYNATSAMKFSLEHQNPLVAGWISGDPSGGYPETTYSLLGVTNPDVLLWALKPHEDGIDRGIVARFWNLSDKESESEIQFESEILDAYRTTHIETDIDRITPSASNDEIRNAVPLTFNRQQLQTIRLKLK